jgi:hypothetical protein
MAKISKRIKRRVRLAEGVYATLVLDLSVDNTQNLFAAIYGMGDEELSNAMSQKIEELADLLGNTEEV